MKKNLNNDMYNFIVNVCNNYHKGIEPIKMSKELNDCFIDRIIFELKDTELMSMCPAIAMACFSFTNNKFAFPQKYFRLNNPKFTKEEYSKFHNITDNDYRIGFWDSLNSDGLNRRIEFLTWLKEQYEENT